MAKSTDKFNDVYTYNDMEEMLESAIQKAKDALGIEGDFFKRTWEEELALLEACEKVEKEFYDKYGWKSEFIDQCEDVNNYDYDDDDDDDDFVCFGDIKVCDKDCKNCPCAHPVEEFI